MSTKRRAIISYSKLTIEQKKQILRDFPDGYINHLTTIKIPTGEVLDALIWETDEVIYLVKINKISPKVVAASDDDDEEDDFEDDLDKVDDIKDDDMEADTETDEEEDYDKPDADDGEDDDSE
jgi:hypothetical protein